MRKGLHSSWAQLQNESQRRDDDDYGHRKATEGSYLYLFAFIIIVRIHFGLSSVIIVTLLCVWSLSCILFSCRCVSTRKRSLVCGRERVRENGKNSIILILPRSIIRPLEFKLVELTFYLLVTSQPACFDGNEDDDDDCD